MGVARTHSAAVLGVDAYVVEAEVDTTPGQFHYSTVGLPDAAVRESQGRVLAALANTGFDPPIKRVTVNLAPADVRKEGSMFDLPIALAFLMAEGLLAARPDDAMIVGELALDGRVKPVRGALPAAICAREKKFKRLIVPVENAPEAAIVGGVEVIPIRSLPEAIGYLEGAQQIAPVTVDPMEWFTAGDHDGMDFAEVKGQGHVKRALEVAAAGGHNLLMIGPPGSGKSMMAQRLPTILPDMTFEEALETTKIHSICGKLTMDSPLVAARPFRSPHHTISDAGLIGGGTIPIPGEVSLAHHGVLFLDELPEFKRSALEALRQPLENGDVTISRAAMAVSFPSRFMLAAAMNPCPCGHATNPEKECACTPPLIRKYRGRISGPLMDRIDIHIEAPAVKYAELAQAAPGEPSAAIRERVNTARRRQLERFGRVKSRRPVYCNAQMSSRLLRELCPLDAASAAILRTAIERLGLSARAHDKAIKVARTIADLEGAEAIRAEHIAEAAQYRTLDREMV